MNEALPIGSHAGGDDVHTEGHYIASVIGRDIGSQLLDVDDMSMVTVFSYQQLV